MSFAINVYLKSAFGLIICLLLWCIILLVPDSSGNCSILGDIFFSTLISDLCNWKHSQMLVMLAVAHIFFYLVLKAITHSGAGLEVHWYCCLLPRESVNLLLTSVRVIPFSSMFPERKALVFQVIASCTVMWHAFWHFPPRAVFILFRVSHFNSSCLFKSQKCWLTLLFTLFAIFELISTM